jgi:lipopolysaccharide biosynthesis protein
MKQSNIPKLIALNLPQFHPIPENDEWWGKGFTEWTNVVKGKPLFKGHYQPHLPADLGFYDLRLPEAREAQAAMARGYGIHGFCYYHYWFGGRRLLERPVNEIVASGKPDFPFCLCWANENWTRVWDGGEREILMQQVYSERDDPNHIRSLIPIFQDRRYIKIDGKPLFLVYRVNRLPNPRQTTETWRREAVRAGLPGLYLLRVESFPDESGSPMELGFDAALEFQPRLKLLQGMRNPRRRFWHRRKLGFGNHPFSSNEIFDYGDLVNRAIAMELPPYPFIRCVCPGWDNTARRRRGGRIIQGSTPEDYERWLEHMVRQVRSAPSNSIPGEPLVFINAWNEWGEGNHLEPCQKWGRAYLEANLRALSDSGDTALSAKFTIQVSPVKSE